LATAKISEKDSRAEINKVFNSFDVNRAVKISDNIGENNFCRAKKGRKRFRRGYD
jgi:hypothetical protein